VEVIILSDKKLDICHITNGSDASYQLLKRLQLRDASSGQQETNLDQLLI